MEFCHTTSSAAIKKLGYINMMDGNSKSIKHVLCWDGSADNNYIWRIVVCGECNMSLLLNAENWRNKKLNCYYKIMYSDNSHLYALAFISRRTHKKNSIIISTPSVSSLCPRFNVDNRWQFWPGNSRARSPKTSIFNSRNASIQLQY